MSRADPGRSLTEENAIYQAEPQCVKALGVHPSICMSVNPLPGMYPSPVFPVPVWPLPAVEKQRAQPPEPKQWAEVGHHAVTMEGAPVAMKQPHPLQASVGCNGKGWTLLCGIQ